MSSPRRPKTEKEKISNRESASRWQSQNWEAAYARQTMWRKDNKDRTAAHKKKWRLKNIEAVRADLRERRRIWRQGNPKKHLAAENLRRARRMDATPYWVDKKALEKIYEDCPPGYHVDHIIPLKHELVCGLHVPWNLQYLPAFANCSKKNKFDPAEWAIKSTNYFEPTPGG